MDYPTIKQLVDKYWEGETTVQEEAQLRRYFNGGKVDPRLQSIQPLFVFFKQEQAKTSQRPLRLWEVLRQRPQRLWGLVAASIAVLLTAALWWCQQPQVPTSNSLASQETKVVQKDTYDDPKEAFRQAKAALFKVSKGLNKGVKATKKSLKKTRD